MADLGDVDRMTDDNAIASAVGRYAAQRPAPRGTHLTPHLRWLEAESIEILREVAAEFRNPVMMYSAGKDSGVMLHVDTTWKFREMIMFRDLMARALGFELLCHVNREGLARIAGSAWRRAAG